MNTPDQTTALPFGKHKGEALSTVPTDYLRWLIANCKLSSGLRAAVVESLAARGVEVPPPAPPRSLRFCADHPGVPPLCFWMEDRLGRRRIRAECRRCRRSVDCPPLVPPFTTMADALASPAPILDALTRMDEMGIEVCSDGRSVWLDCENYRKTPPDLQAIIRQCSHQLAGLLGDNRKPSPAATPRPTTTRGTL